MPIEVCEARDENDNWRILSVECADVECDCCTPECEESTPTREPTTEFPTSQPAEDTETPTEEVDATFEPTEETADPTPVPVPTPAPTAEEPAPVAAPTPIGRPTSDSREDQIFLQLTAITDPATLDNPRTPQGEAYQWIVNDDPRQLEPGDPTLDQRYILTTLYYATEGAGWTECFEGATNEECGQGLFPNANAFLSEESECTWGYWAGNSCNSEGALRAIQIPNNNLIGSLPSEISALPALDTLSLEQNGLTGSLFEVWPPSLFRLRLSKNSFTGTLGAGLPSELSLLYMDENQLTGPLDDVIGSLQDVSQLHLQSNAFTGTIPESLGDLTSLRVARFEENELSGTMPEQVCANREEDPAFRFLVTDCPPQFDCSCCSNRCTRQ